MDNMPVPHPTSNTTFPLNRCLLCHIEFLKDEDEDIIIFVKGKCLTCMSRYELHLLTFPRECQNVHRSQNSSPC